LIVVVVALVVGAVLFSNAPPQTSNNVNVLSFTYDVSNNTFTFHAADGFTNYSWDFGDSSTGAGSVVSHTPTRRTETTRLLWQLIHWLDRQGPCQHSNKYSLPQ